MSTRTTPTRIDLKKSEKLTVEFADGKRAEFSLAKLRTNCPCASCRAAREAQSAKPRRLNVLGTFNGETAVVSAELVGNYALRLEWSDDHNSGIYSFEYLRQLAEQ
ncbi:MAG TPA: DUF971 domain-containing protein [Tepidisphaeraceae bacterium]|nr:DUF971 domain-containing protein [Tepidisphaeraceae bacterium]